MNAKPSCMNQTRPPIVSVHAMLTAVLVLVSGSVVCANDWPTLRAKHVASIPASMKNLRFMKIAECFSNAFCAKVVAFVNIFSFFIIFHRFRNGGYIAKYKSSCDLFITFMKNWKNTHKIAIFMDNLRVNH